MTETRTERLRLLGTTDDGATLRLADVEDHAVRTLPTADVTASMAGEAAGSSASPPPAGSLLEVEREWTDGGPTISAVAVVEETRLSFVDGATNLFEAALDTWAAARREGLAVNSRVTYDGSREPVGALYTFAEQSGPRDIFEELRSGRLPLEPLLERAAERADPPFAVFVLRPVAHEFVLVYVVLDPDSTLAATVRETYDAPRPR